MNIALFATFDGALDLWMSFFASTLILTFILIYHLFVEKVYSPFISAFIVFTFLFFVVAPMVQINSFVGENPAFANNFPYNKGPAIYTNVLISIFNIVFFAAYVFFKNVKGMHRVPQLTKSSRQLTPLLIVSLTIFTLLIFVGSLGFVFDELSRPAWQRSGSSVGAFLLWKKVLFLVPFAGLILCFHYFRGCSKKNIINIVTIASVFLVFGLILLWFKNPLVEKRNALGPMYISILFLLVPRLFNTNIKTLFFLFFTMIVAFPLSAILTHSEASFQEILENPSVLLDHMKGGGIASAFNTLNYDAFSNIIATMDYVQQYGFSLGNQLLSAYLFFVPRGFWEDKPISTGQLVGEHLIDNYEFTYSNLSNPLVSEGYINFGVFGVIVGAVLLSFVITRAIAWLKSDDYLKKIMAFYLAIHLIFLLRGDFTNGFSYYIGALAGVIVIPKLIELMLKYLFNKQHVWKQTATLRD
jgi:hypothetical protein